MSELQGFEIQEDFSDIVNCSLVDVVIDDTMMGHKIIVVSACNLPNSDEIDHARLLRYLTHALSEHVERNYVLVYFHHGLTSKNNPPIKWLWHAYGQFNRKYKKNLKTLYLVHPTVSLKLIWQFFKTIVSEKFRRKVVYVNSLQELKQYLNLNRIVIPTPVLNHDKQLMAQRDRVKRNVNQSEPRPTQQFGVSLKFIKANNNAEMIPPFARKCIESLDRSDALSTVKLFGKSADADYVSRDLKNRIDRGELVDIGSDNVHIWAGLLLTFLRELKEPLMTYELFDEIIQFKLTPKDERLGKVKIIILDKLPLYNYYFFKYLVQFISKVADESELNKMNSDSLALVFGPVLVRSPNGRLSIDMLCQITCFIDFIIVNHKQIFII